MNDSPSQAQQLEQYSQHHPHEILLVTIQYNEQRDQIMIYKGFSSSLMNSTEFNPDIPILPEEATIIRIDRLKSPYNSQNPQYLEQGLTWETMQPRLTGLS